MDGRGCGLRCFGPFVLRTKGFQFPLLQHASSSLSESLLDKTGLLRGRAVGTSADERLLSPMTSSYDFLRGTHTGRRELS